MGLISRVSSRTYRKFNFFENPNFPKNHQKSTWPLKTLPCLAKLEDLEKPISTLLLIKEERSCLLLCPKNSELNTTSDLCLWSKTMKSKSSEVNSKVNRPVKLSNPTEKNTSFTLKEFNEKKLEDLLFTSVLPHLMWSSLKCD